MNRLKRPGLPRPPSSDSSSTTSMSVSRTLALASGQNSTKLAKPEPPTFDVQPRTNVEQYWAARALKAESFISARITHENEIRTLRSSEELKRSNELGALRQENDTRISKLETLVLLLFACLFSMSVFLIYLLSHTVRQPQTPKKSSLSHFTISILSPFSSVVEHETSTIGTKSIMFLFVVLALLAYAVFRRWMSQKHYPLNR